MTKVAFLIIGTNKYFNLAEQCADSILKHIKVDDGEVTPLIFTNAATANNWFKHKLLHVEHKPWPLITLLRYHSYIQYQDILSEYDYLYHIDADNLVVNPIDWQSELKGDLVATKHPGWWGQNSAILPFERNSRSNAYIPFNQYAKYYFGSFQGGRTTDYLKACEVMKRWIDEDLKNHHLPIWDDESMLNRYLYETPPTVELGNQYAFVEKFNPNVTPKILCLDKDHESIRK